MPLISAKKKGSKKEIMKAISKNISKEMHSGKPQKQAIAIAYSKAREDKPSMKESLIKVIARRKKMKATKK